MNRTPSPIGECAVCGYVGSPHASSACPKCGGAWKYIEVDGTGNSKAALSGVRIQNPLFVSGEKMNVTTMKVGIDDDVYASTIKRTVEGESADLQIMFRVNKDGTAELLHVHCQYDKESSEWGKASGRSIDEFYEISQVNGEQIIRCKVCERRWSSVGRMTQPSAKRSVTPL